MKDAAEAVDKLLSQLGTLLRYVAPGFAALFVVGAIIPESQPFLSSASPTGVALAVLLGPTIYGVHIRFNEAENLPSIRQCRF